MSRTKNLLKMDKASLIAYLKGLSEPDSEDVSNLIVLLDLNPNLEVKHIIAHLLHDIGDPKSVEPLIKEIRKSSNENYRGPFVYACEAFDCSEHLEFFVELVIEDSYEVAMTAVMVIENMQLKFSDKLLRRVISKLDEGIKKESKNIESILEVKKILSG